MLMQLKFERTDSWLTAFNFSGLMWLWFDISTLGICDRTETVNEGWSVTDDFQFESSSSEMLNAICHIEYSGDKTETLQMVEAIQWNPNIMDLCLYFQQLTAVLSSVSL